MIVPRSGQLAVLAVMFAACIPVASAQTDTAAAPATFVVVHGIAGRDVAGSLDPVLPVDVLVAGKYCLLQGLTFGTIAGPFEVPAGSYPIAVSLANPIAPCTNTPVISATATLAAGSFASIVATLNTMRAPTAEIFTDNISIVPKGDQRLIAAHAALAPAVDVTVKNVGGTSESLTFPLKPGDERTALVSARTGFAVLISPVGSNVTVGPVTVNPGNRGVALVYAVGSVGTGSVELISKVLPDAF